jgi:HAD superfamily phosphatase (TIGR01668 family)
MTAPTLPPYGKWLTPHVRVASVFEIDRVWLKARGIHGLIFDLDDTLVCALEPKATDDVCAWIDSIRQEFKVYIVSNNASLDRVSTAATHLAMPHLAQAFKPSRRIFRKALEAMALQANEVAIVGDQLFTDVLGGHRLGATTILVDPLSTERKWFRKWMRRLETTMLKAGKVGYHPHGPHFPHS